MEIETTFFLNVPVKLADVVDNINFLSNSKFSALSLSADNSTCLNWGQLRTIREFWVVIYTPALHSENKNPLFTLLDSACGASG